MLLNGVSGARSTRMGQVTKNNEFGVKSVRLFTKWDTVLYFDIEHQRLRHGSMRRTPANLTVQTEGDSIRLVLERAGRYQPIICDATGCFTRDGLATSFKTL